jgi:predicted esterase
MPTVEGFELDLADRSGFPVAIGHGAADPVIGVEFGRDARDRLSKAGAAVTYEEHPGGHHVDPRFAAGLADWLTDISS